MNNLEHAFDPSVSALYSHRNVDGLAQKDVDIVECRELFYKLNQSGKDDEIMSRAYDLITQGLSNVKRVYPSLLIQDYSKKLLTSFKVLKIQPLPEPLFNQVNLHKCINQTAAIHLTQPCWLQNTFQISASQTTTAIHILSIYLQLTQTEPGNPDLQKSYQSLLLAAGFEIPALHDYGYSQQPEIMPVMIEFATLQLALSKFPRLLLPEILGFTLAYCQMPTLIEVCFPHHPLPSLFFKLHQGQVKICLPLLHSCIANYLDLFPQHQPALWQRIQNGFWLYQLQMQRCRDQFSKSLEKSLSPQEAIAKVFQKKAAAAQGHHQNIQLQGVPLDNWFAGMPENIEQFLQALKQSNYVDSKKPEQSPLLKLFDFNGPMFGILDKAEQDILRNWLNTGLTETVTSVVKKPEKTDLTLLSTQSFCPIKNYAKLSNRELYHYLVNADLYPEVLPAAKHKAQTLLRVCSFFTRPPFKQYTHERFNTYIDQIYQQEINAYQPLQGKPKTSKKAYVWGLEQIAPMILIDGCWLQNSLALQNASPDICKILFQIYCDEVGNGKLEHNHPYIFQQLLNSLSIQVPSVHSAEFIEHPGFINSAFDLPVYMLSLSSFPVFFLPELLGLNMAIELSGLGKGYMQLVDEMNYWGINPSIATTHISIDNIASGHTFLAKKAIQIYMDETLKNTGDNAILDSHWQRIYSGYASLRFVGKRFKLGLPIWYLIHKIQTNNKINNV